MDERCDKCNDDEACLKLTDGDCLCSCCFTELAQKSHNTQHLNSSVCKE